MKIRINFNAKAQRRKGAKGMNTQRYNPTPTLVETPDEGFHWTIRTIPLCASAPLRY